MSVDDLIARALDLHRAGDRAAAAAVYERILDRAPDHPDALHLSGVLAMEQGDLARARRNIDGAIAILPAADYLNSRGNLARAEGDDAAARASYAAAVAAEPAHRDAHYNLALMMERAGDLVAAKEHFGRAVAADDGFALGHYALGRVALRGERYEDAAPRFSAALALDETFAAAQNGLGFALEKMNRLGDAIPRYREAARLEPENPEILNNLGNALHASARISEAVDAFRRCLELDPENRIAWDRYLFALTFDGAADIATHARENRRWGERAAAAIGAAPRRFDNVRDPARRLRIGYVSAEYFDHIAMHFFRPVILGHDRAAFEIACYALGDAVKADGVTAEIRASADIWRDAYGASPTEAAEIIAADRVDIVVGITNFLASNRLVLAHRPAPITVSYMNQVGTTGLEAVDYLIANEHLYPGRDADALFPETIVRLVDFDTYGPPDAAPIEPPPAAATGRVTFGSFSGLPKIGPDVVALWARILREVADSRLILVSPGLDDETQRRRLRDEFGARGIAGDRLELIGRIPGRTEYISTYNRIDIALDPFPFGGGTVTNEAMFMGVPVIALDGDYGYRRMTVGLLANAGCDELIASDLDGYVRRAAELAADPVRIASYKSGLRARCRATIFNSKGHVRELENAYRAMWNRYCRS